MVERECLYQRVHGTEEHRSSDVPKGCSSLNLDLTMMGVSSDVLAVGSRNVWSDPIARVSRKSERR